LIVVMYTFAAVMLTELAMTSTTADCEVAACSV